MPDSPALRWIPSLLLASSLMGCASVPALPPIADAGLTVRTQSPLPRAVVADQATLGQLDVVTLSANFVDRVIHGLPVQQHLARFTALDAEALDASLDTRARQTAFWINIYNGYTQYFLQSDPSLYINDRPAYFGAKQVDIAGYQVSLETIEHGVLRRGATIYTLGHVRLLFFRSAFVKRFAVDAVDYRLHFALNCGALSCPAVVPYTAEGVNAELDASARRYLQQEVEIAGDVAWVPALMRWFSADFGNKRAVLRRYGLIGDGDSPKLKYKKYDWTLKVENYAAVIRP